MIPVVSSCTKVVEKAKIKIDNEACQQLSNKISIEIQNDKLSHLNFNEFPLHPKQSDGSAADWIFVVDSINYCFWTPSTDYRWTVTWHGVTHSGYYGLCAAVNRAIEEGIAMTNPEVYSKLSLEDVKWILRGDNKSELLLLKERHQCLQESGNVLLKKFNGSFVNCIQQCHGSAQELLKTIVDNFSYFRDDSVYDDISVGFYKRAQIVIGDIWCCYDKKGLGEFNDIDTITMFADYRVPQVLCYFGVLQYPDSLLLKLSEGGVLEKDSKEEIEIRATSIIAVEQINKMTLELLKSNGTEKSCNSILIDNYLWDYRRKHNKYLECIPYHKTISIYY